MKQVMKRIFTAVLSFSFVTTAFAEVELGKVGTITADQKLENAQLITPEENIFSVDGKKFIVLDTSFAETDGFFIMAEDLYGTSKIDLTTGISQNSSVAKFDVLDENNIAYWLNHDFMQNGNGEDYTLPKAICENILTHTWRTEPCNAEGFTKEYTQEYKLSLLSDYEYRTYIEKIGHTPSISNAVSFYLRTACSEGVNNAACYALAVNFRSPGTTVSPKATVAQYIRPVFYLSSSFFEENKVEDIGKNVLLALNEFCDGAELSEIYTEEEMNTYFPRPTAKINAILGNCVEGGTLHVDYDYDYTFQEGDSKIEWYASDTQTTDYKKIAEGAELVLGAEHIGKYITVSVKPIGSKGAISQGETVMLETGIGPVIGSNSLAEIFKSLQTADDMTQILTDNNNIFGLDLSLLTDENKEFVFSVIRKAELKQIADLQNAYETGMTFCKMQQCTYEDFAELVKKVLSEQVYTQYENLTEEAKKKVFAQRAEYKREEDILKEIVCAAVAYGNPENIVSLFLQEDALFTTSFAEQGEYRTALVAASLMGREFESFSALNAAADQKANEVKEAIVRGEELQGLAVQNRTSQTAPLDGALAKTPEDNLFSYDGKSFIVLDSMKKNGKTYLFVMTKEYYGKRSIDTTPDRAEADAQAKYDMNDPYNIAYWLNHDFIFTGNGGQKLPVEMVRNMDIDHIWHTEPSNVAGYGKEHLDVGPVALMSNTEWKKYITEFGLDTNNSSGGAYMRSARAGAVLYSNKQLTTYFGGAGSTLEQTATLPAYVRPVFYLDTEFFKEYKVSAIGARLAGILQEEMAEDLLKIYTEEELKTYFKAPTVENVQIVGYPVTDSVLSATYGYISSYPETKTKVEWLAADTPTGSYTAVTEGKTLTLSPELNGKYIKVKITPVSSAKINAVGTGVTVDVPVGAVVDKSILLSRINSASDKEIFDVMRDYGEVLVLDLELAELSNKERVAKMLAAEEFKSIEEIYAAYKQAVAIEKINEAAEEEIIALLADAALPLDQTRYAALSDKSGLAQALAGQGYEKIADFTDACYENMALLEFEKIDRTKVRDFLLFYDKIFTAEIEKLSDTLLNAAGIKLIKNKVSDYVGLDNAVTNAVSDAKNDVNSGTNKPSVSPSGGGGSSSGSKVGYTYVTQNESLQQVIQQQTNLYFSDLADVAWAAEKIEVLAELGIISGMADGTFNPQSEVTREQFVQMVVTALGLTASENTKKTFTDVEADAWYANAIIAAVENGIVQGVDAETFGVGQLITRQDMAAIIARALGITPEENTLAFTDTAEIADYAKDSIAALLERGIVSGFEDKTFRPSAETTRAQAAVVIYGLLEQKERK